MKDIINKIKDIFYKIKKMYDALEKVDVEQTSLQGELEKKSPEEIAKGITIENNKVPEKTKPRSGTPVKKVKIESNETREKPCETPKEREEREER